MQRYSTVFRRTLGFREKLAGVPQAHLLSNKTDECNFFYIHIRTLIVTFQEFINKRAILQYKVFIIKKLKLRHVRPFLVAHPQRVYSNICVKHRL
jgi:hypothetical protein